MAHRFRILLTVVVTVVLALVALAPAAQSAAPSTPTVMTRNIYLGADLTPAIVATDVPSLLAANAGIFSAVQATDFPARAKLLAKEIDDSDPYLIGLQEVALWRRGPIGTLDGPATPATEVVYDFQKSLLDELAARGLKYKVVAKQEEADLESPAGSPYFRDFRLTMHDVILARTDLPPGLFSVSNGQGGNYSPASTLVIPTFAGNITVKRGWTSVDVSIARKPALKFVNTHLEAFHPGVRAQQAGELVAGPTNTTKPVILVGDLNSDPASSFPNNAAYGIVTGSGGFVDAAVDAGTAANTCCHADDLLDYPTVFGSRIDHVLTRPGTGGVLSTEVIGNDPANRTTGGLWPSDHGGVIAKLAP